MATTTKPTALANDLLQSLVRVHEFEALLDQQIVQLLQIQKMNKAAIMSLHNNLKTLADKHDLDSEHFKAPIPSPLPDMSATSFAGGKQ